MMPFRMVVRHELGNCSSQRALTKQDHPLSAGFFDGPYKSFGLRIPIRGAWRSFHGLDPHPGQQAQKFGREEWITIVNQIALAVQDSVDRIRHTSANLAHP